MTDAPNADEREGAVVSVSAGSLPSLSGSGDVAGDAGKREIAVRYVDPADWRAASPVEKHRLATPIWLDSRNSFRHAMWVSGAPVVLFTATIGSNGGLIGIGGARNGPRAPGDNRAGYFSEFYDIYAVAGGRADVYGIPTYEGPMDY